MDLLSWGIEPSGKSPRGKGRAAFDQLPARLQVAVVARADEKACWGLLKVGGMVRLSCGVM